MTNNQRRRQRRRLESLRALIAAKGNVCEAVAEEAQKRIDDGRIWGIEEDLAACGVAVDDDIRALLNRYVALNISDARHDVKARVYTKKGEKDGHEGATSVA